MNWLDDAIVLAARPHGERSAILSMFCREHGRAAGLVRSRPKSGSFPQPGSVVQVSWRARLADHLGIVVCEPTQGVVLEILESADRLAALASMCALLETALLEREPYPHVFAGATVLLANLAQSGRWLEDYIRWELELLFDLGYGLDFSGCAAGGDDDDLAYVSPRSGRAVSRAKAAPYVDRLLPLPPFLLGSQVIASTGEVLQGLHLTRYFLERHVYAAVGRTLPGARLRLAEIIGRRERDC